MSRNDSPGPWGIHWFRRDLRITGNKALRDIWTKTQGRTLGIFCFDSKFLSRPDFSANRFAFFLKTLRALKSEFEDMGGSLLVVDQLPYDFFRNLLEGIGKKNKSLPQFVSWNRDYEPFARERDGKMAAFFAEKGIITLTARDHLIFEPHEIKKDDGGYYQVFTPFFRKWFDCLRLPANRDRISCELAQLKPAHSQVFHGSWKDLNLNFVDRLDEFTQQNQKNVTISIPEAGHSVALQKLKHFAPKLNSYNEQRDRPDLAGTSGLSLFLKNGSLTTAQIAKTLNLPALGPSQFLKEIVWREFYYHILFHRPDVESGSFNPQYKNIVWENREDHFELWKEGKTGFPIVDAGMRQLRQTGWMHNRVRMIVASFLVKDLLIDWRWGERHFMRELLDGDLAPNNGGWQWAASTGCDPQPYFRIFNPWLQSKKFDPDGLYIKKYVPELKTFSTTTLHEPDADRTRTGYPDPIVDHMTQKKKALKLYKKI